VIVGGGGPRRTPEIAARFATEYNIGFRPEPEIAAAFDRVRAACARIARDPATLKLSVALPTIAGPDERTLARRAEAAGRSLDDFRNGTNLCGTAPEIAEKVERLIALGAQRVYFQTVDMRDLDQTAYLGAEVLPLLPR
jgi:alkanesulfonate monooxygenase SsuD/methylene tetrahydromethanopterin reductase-like flavin-dependent oxidoreductase (luciferase family)